jgi:outer membrane protein assembly factor BamB
MLQRARRLSACLIAIVAFVGGLSANQKPNSEVSHWSVVSRPALGPDGTIYVLGSVGDVHHPDDPERSGGSIYGPGGNYLYAVKPDGTQRWSFTLGSSEIHE